MLRRPLVVYRSLLGGQLGGDALPLAPILLHALVAAVLLLLVRGELAPFGYAVVALSLSAALVALSLLGELGALLRTDPAREWSLALPLRAADLHIARVLLGLTLVLFLALGALVPAVLLMPDGASLADRAVLLGVGFGQAICLAAALMALQSVLGERAEGLLVALQTVLVVGIVVGATLLPALLVTLLADRGPQATAPSALAWLPSTWFALPIGAPPPGLPGSWLTALLIAGGLALLALLPPVAAPRARRGKLPLARLLTPLCAPLERLWVARAERASYRLVWEALPLERDFVLRTYPMLGIPLAFLLVGVREEGPQREGLLAVLLFSPAIYLPVLLAHVPATATPDARWMLDLAPLPRAALDAGARKAVALRFVVPLMLLLAGLAASMAGLDFALRMAPVALLVAILLLRNLYPRFALDVPLSLAPDSIDVSREFGGALLTLVFFVPIAAVLAQHRLTTVGSALVVVLALLALEAALELRDRRRYPRAAHR